MKRVLVLMFMLTVLFTETCFADVSIPVTYKSKGTPEKNTKIVVEMSDIEGQDSLKGKTLSLNMTNRTKASFDIPIEEPGWYEYDVVKKTVNGSRSKQDPQKYKVKVLITSEGEKSYAIAKGDEKEDSIAYSDTFRTKPHKHKTRRRTQTGDNLMVRLLIGVIGAVILFFTVRALKWRSPDSLDI